MFTIKAEGFTQTVTARDSAIRILVNCGVPKSWAKLAVQEMDNDETWFYLDIEISRS